MQSPQCKDVIPVENLIQILTACVPVLVALVGIIPTVISNRKKTQESLQKTTEAIEKRMDKLQSSYDTHVADYEAARASSQRYRILRFYDEVCEGRKHSESHFEDILDDIDSYENYCESHKEYKNNRGHVAMQYIRDTYARVKAKGGFLTHN